jgi:hypothetical protein
MTLHEDYNLTHDRTHIGENEKDSTTTAKPRHQNNYRHAPEAHMAARRLAMTTTTTKQGISRTPRNARPSRVGIHCKRLLPCITVHTPPPMPSMTML